MSLLNHTDTVVGLVWDIEEGCFISRDGNVKVEPLVDGESVRWIGFYLDLRAPLADSDGRWQEVYPSCDDPDTANIQASEEWDGRWA